LISRRRFLAAAAAAPAAGAAATPPNVVLILADDLGYGDLSSYGAPDMRTPHIDALMSAGVRFDRFYANSPVCSPTRAALLSGCYPDVVGVPGVIRTHETNSWGYLSPRADLLPKPLKAAGYHTAIIGKWHLGLESPNTPTERGFDHFHGFLGDMMDDYYTHLRHGHNYMRRNREVIQPEGHATELFTRWAVEYLNGRKSERRPFFLYLAYNAPHAPIQPPEEWLARVKARQPGISEKRARLVALVEHMDDAVGRVVAALKANGQYQNTLLIFVSDNGGDLNAGGTSGPLRSGKGDMFEGGIRVPMCAVWPGRIPAGSRSECDALTMDLYPTICEAAGARAPAGIDGQSLLAVLEGKQKTLPSRDLIWVRREGGPRYQGQDYYALRRGDWKLLQNSPFEPYQLYHLKDDPGEKNDLASKEKKIYAELSAALMKHIQRAGRVPWQPPS
jgi:arylsulfatase A-like enzyme